MPDSAKQPTPDDPSKSHTQLKAAVPHDQGKAAQLTMELGSREHRATFEEVPMSEAEQLPERRRAPGMTTVINPPAQSGGLPGLWGVAYQATGITIIFGVFIWMMFTNRADRREEAAQSREERAIERSQNQAAFAAMAGTLTTISTRNEIRDVKIDAAVDEIRRAVESQKLVNMEILSVLKSIRDGKGNGNGPLGEAPRPRSRSVGKDGDGAIGDDNRLTDPPPAGADDIEGGAAFRRLALHQERRALRVPVLPDEPGRVLGVGVGE